MGLVVSLSTKIASEKSSVDVLVSLYVAQLLCCDVGRFRCIFVLLCLLTKASALFLRAPVSYLSEL